MFHFYSVSYPGHILWSRSIMSMCSVIELAWNILLPFLKYTWPSEKQPAIRENLTSYYTFFSLYYATKQIMTRKHARMQVYAIPELNCPFCIMHDCPEDYFSLVFAALASLIVQKVENQYDIRQMRGLWSVCQASATLQCESLTDTRCLKG